MGNPERGLADHTAAWGVQSILFDIHHAAGSIHDRK